MTSPDWVPFGMGDDELAEYQTLVSGVPEWMRSGLFRWLGDQFCANRLDTVWAQKVIRAETAIRVDLGSSSVTAGNHTFPRSVVDTYLARLDGSVWLRLADYLLTHAEPSARSRLDELLTSAGSQWKVGDRAGFVGLVERVPAGVQAVVESTIGNAGDAGRLLARAWSKAHGLTPDAPGAYADAVRAVEIAAIAVVMPKKADATLGNVIGQMEADGDWRLPLREHGKAPSADMVVAMLRTLWFGHRDRHGTPLGFQDVNQQEARAAVVLAASVIDWFDSGALAHKP